MSVSIATFHRQIPNSLECDAENVQKMIRNQEKGELNPELLISGSLTHAGGVEKFPPR
jgi:hypothetical protein